MRAESYLTHKVGLSTDFSHEDGQIQHFGQVRPMRFAAMVAAFLIGLISGLAMSEPVKPDITFKADHKFTRRGVD